MGNQISTICPGCQRNELHKMCPAWGTKYYMSGTLFTPELEEETREERQKSLEEKRASDDSFLD